MCELPVLAGHCAEIPPRQMLGLEDTNSSTISETSYAHHMPRGKGCQCHCNDEKHRSITGVASEEPDKNGVLSWCGEMTKAQFEKIKKKCPLYYKHTNMDESELCRASTLVLDGSGCLGGQVIPAWYDGGTFSCKKSNCPFLFWSKVIGARKQ